MKKKLLVGVLSAVLLIGGATAAIAATDSTKLDEIKSLTQQMFSIHKQIVDKEVEAGLINQEQAAAMKSALDQRLQASEIAITNGQVPNMSLGKGKRGDRNVNIGQTMTEDQIKTWSDAAQKRLQAQVDAMKATGKFTDDQIKTWTDAAQAQLKIQEEALKNGIAIPGGYGMSGGKGMRGGKGDCSNAPKAGTTDNSSDTSTTTN